MFKARLNPSCVFVFVYIKAVIRSLFASVFPPTKILSNEVPIDWARKLIILNKNISGNKYDKTPVLYPITFINILRTGARDVVPLHAVISSTLEMIG